MKRIISLLFAFSFGLAVFGQTTISNDITANTTWSPAGNPYTVTDTIEVADGVTLTILPGVTVSFNEFSRLEVFGTLSAIGTVTDSIFFYLDTLTATNQFGWRGIYSTDTVFLAYVNLGKAQYGVNMDGHSYNLVVEHSTFRLCDYGIAGDENFSGPWTHIVESTFKDNFIGIYEMYFADIRGCTFTRNHIGCENLWLCDVRDCHFSFHIQNALGISIGEVVDNTFVNNGYASFFGFADYINPITGVISDNHIFRGNEIRDNNAGLTLLLNDTIRAYPHTISENIFCQNDVYNVVMNWTIPIPFTIDLAENCWCSTDSLSIDSTIIHNNHNYVLLPIDSMCVGSSKPVFPGDANFNQVCNHLDLLYVGLKFGDTGPSRPNASLNWVPQSAPDWPDTLINGVNAKHADCDGNGTVNFNDTLAINLNFGLTHTFSRPTASGGIPLYLSTATPTFFPGDTVTFAVNLGTFDTTAINTYGLGFIIHYDTSQVEPGSVYMNFHGSWLGNKNQDLITFGRDVFEEGEIFVSLSRTDQMDRSDYGRIADLIVVIDDDIYKRALPFDLAISQPFALDANGQDIEINAQGGSFNIEDPSTAMMDLLSQHIEILPSQAPNEIRISHAGIQVLDAQLVDIQGRMIMGKWEHDGGQSIFSHASVSDGVYFLRLRTSLGNVTLKVVEKF